MSTGKTAAGALLKSLQPKFNSAFTKLWHKTGRKTHIGKENTVIAAIRFDVLTEDL
jgi:hypothetical protein